MKEYLYICLLFFCFISYSSATLVDGIVTLSWSPNQPVPIIDRFLSNSTRIQLKVLCYESSYKTSVTEQQIKNKLYNSNKIPKDTNVVIRGRIGRIDGCLPFRPDTLLSSTQAEQKSQVNIWQTFYEQLWNKMEQRTFVARQTNCDSEGTYLNIDEYSSIIKPIKSSKQTERLSIRDNNEKSSALINGVRSATGTMLTWNDGYYLIEIYQPEVISSDRSLSPAVDVIVSMKTKHGNYITADEYPALVFYGVMCAIYAIFAIVWFIVCALYWKELLKIQFWIGAVILLGMIEKSAFLAEYDTLNRNGYKVHYAIVTAEILSCLKRTISRLLVIMVALGYGIVKPRLGPLKQKVFAIGTVYFAIASIEAMLRINTKNDERNDKVLMSRIPLAIIDALIYYWIFTGLIATTKILRLKNNLIKLNVYRHFTNTVLLAIIASLLFMVWSLKAYFFTKCITNWREFWIDDAFWHVLFSMILLVIMLLFRPSNNNQRYASVPLLDESDTDEFNEEDQKGESITFDTITMRKATNSENWVGTKSKKHQQYILNRESNIVNNENNTVDDDLTWVENNIPTSIADQALQTLDDGDEIVNTKLERSKIQ